MIRFVGLGVVAAALEVCSGGVLSAQQPDNPPQAQTPADNGGLPATLSQPHEQSPNYVNFFAFVNGVYDTSTAGSNGGVRVSGEAVEGGGGVTANHDFARGVFSLSYRGDYHSYADPLFPSGTDQSLNLLFRKLLTRRWTFSLQETGGIYPLGTTLQEPTVTTQNNILQTTPFAVKTKFTATDVSFAYVQTLRLSYEFTGSFSLLRYNAPISYGMDDFGGTGSMLYRLTRNTTLSGTYQYSGFLYQHGAGSANSNTLYGTLSHNFVRHWTAGISGGATLVSDSGTVELPVDVEIGSILVPVYVQGRYSHRSTLPYAQASISHSWRNTVFTATGGESVVPGNGFFLASRNIGLSGVFSYNLRRSNISASGFYSRLTSVSNTSSARVRTADLSLSYGYNLFRHLGINFRFDHLNYGSIGPYGGTADNRVLLGFYFSSKNVPLALF